MVIDITPDLDPSKLSQKEKMELVRQSDGLLIELFENEKIRGDLYLWRYTSLTHLPDGLEVGGNLYLGRCTSLTHLPEGLKVGGYLCLEKCIFLTHLPKGLKVGGDLILEGCTGLAHLKGKKIKGVKGKVKNNS